MPTAADFAYICFITTKYKSMEKLLEQINDRIAAFQKDAYLQWFKGNKAAGRRARKAALELMALLKEFRKAYLEAGR